MLVNLHAGRNVGLVDRKKIRESVVDDVANFLQMVIESERKAGM